MRNVNAKPTLKTEFLGKLLNKQVTVFQMNGFQIRGKLLGFDESGIKILTTQYSSTSDVPREIFIQNHAYSSVI